MTRRLVLGVVLCVGAAVQAAAFDVVISEFMASNRNVLQDQDGDSSDWLELYNAGHAAVDLQDWCLTDNASLPAKWRFPAVTLDAGSYLLVFCSGKDRAVAGQELHTNFRLSADGEYLGLVAPDGVTVVHEYAPRFPPQLTDRSYGLSQDVDIEYLVPPEAPVRVAIPQDGSLGDAWKGGMEPFDDSVWISGRAGVGYVSLVDGFLVRNISARTQVSSLSVAESVIRDPELQLEVHTEIAPVINYLGTGGGGHYPNPSPFPGTVAGADHDDFVIEATAIVTIPEAGAWTFGVLSDDGFGLDLRRGAEVFRIEYPAPRGPGDTLGTMVVATPGDYELRLVMYERGGGSCVELYAAKGTHGAWHSGFVLVGDTARGGLVARSAVGADGSLGGFGNLIATDVEAQMAGSACSAFIRMPFEEPDPGRHDALFLRMRYDDGFIAYLNGVEIARRNAPALPAYDACATWDRPGSESQLFEDINVTFALPFLRTGANVLAFHALNSHPDSGVFLLYAELARITVDLGVPGYFETPTPRAPNATAFLNVVRDVQFSVKRGLFDGPFDLAMTTGTEGAVIRYTLDGTPPLEDGGHVYHGPLRIDRTTVLRAAAAKDGYVPSNIGTQTYLFLDDVIRQDYAATIAAGFPTMWGGTTPNYGLDRRVVGQDGTDAFGGKYAGTIKDDLQAIPTLSIVMDIDHMFGSQGIYTHSTNRGVAWERPASIEFFDPRRSGDFQEDCGIRIHGGAFRSHSLTKKHSLRLLFKGIYGATKLRWPVFGPGTPDRFDTIVLRANSNDGWQWASVGGNALYVRDSYMRELALDMGGVASHGRFVHVYINGIYWGMYNVSERPDAAMSSTYFGGKKADWDALSHRGIKDGTRAAWDAMLALVNAGLASNEAYFRIQGKNPDGEDDPALRGLLDVENFADYMIANLYGGNTDWPHNNYWVGFNRVDSTGFKYYMWDAEWVMGIGSNLSTNRVGVGDGVAAPWPRLRENAEFRVLVGDRIQRTFFNGGPLWVDPSAPAWDPERPERNRAAERFVELTGRIDRAIVAESARWGGQHGTLYTRDEHWAVTRANLLNNYFPQRSAVVVQQFRNAGLYPSIDAPRFSREGGPIDPGFVLHITAAQGNIYYTRDGADPREIGGAIAPSALQGGSAATVTLVAEGAPARVLVPASGALGLAWTAPEFNDAAWTAGTAALGYERSSGYESYFTTDVGAAMYNINPSVYVRIPFSVDDASAYAFMHLLVRYDDGFIAYLNGERVAARNAPADPQWNSAATQNNDDAAAIQFERILLDDAARHLRAGTNVLAVHGLNVPVNSSDFLLVPVLEATRTWGGGGIVLDDSTLVRARALHAGQWSALAEALYHVPRPIEALRITEIMYHPLGTETVDEDAFEFLELKNTGDAVLDLTGVSIVAGVYFTFPEGAILPPGGFAVLVADPVAFAWRYPGVAISGVYAGGLSNSGEVIALVDAEGVEFLRVPYDSGPPYPANANGLGPSLVPVDPSAAGDPTRASWWRASTLIGGSPGRDDPEDDSGFGLQLPGDINQDGALDISDVVGYLRLLFSGQTFDLPCEGDSIQAGANLLLLDVNDDGRVDVADPIFLLSYLFQDGAAPYRGTRCMVIEGCPRVCRP